MGLLRARPKAKRRGQDTKLSGQDPDGAQVELILGISVALQHPEESFPPSLSCNVRPLSISLVSTDYLTKTSLLSGLVLSVPSPKRDCLMPRTRYSEVLSLSIKPISWRFFFSPTVLLMGCWLWTQTDYCTFARARSCVCTVCKVQSFVAHWEGRCLSVIGPKHLCKDNWLDTLIPRQLAVLFSLQLLPEVLRCALSLALLQWLRSRSSPQGQRLVSSSLSGVSSSEQRVVSANCFIVSVPKWLALCVWPWASGYI